MAHVDEHAAALGAPALDDLGVARAGHHVARGALHALGVVALHVALARRVLEVSARAAQALLQKRAGYLEAVSRQDARRVELHHLHVAERGARLPRNRHAVGGELLRAGRDL